MSRTSKWWDRNSTKVNSLTGAESPDEPHVSAWKWATGLESSEGADRKSRANDALTLYFGSETHCTFDDTADVLAVAGLATAPDAVAYNVIQACTDTMISHIVRNKVRPMFLTERGNPEQREKATGMQRAIEGVFDEAGIYGELGREVCTRGELFDAGVVKVCPDYANNRVDISICWAHEFFVSRREAQANNIRQLAHVFDVDRESLLDFFKESGEDIIEAIRNAPPVSVQSDHESVSGETVADRVKVCELWHLPSGTVDLDKPESFGLKKVGEGVDPDVDPGHDGRRVMCIEHATLLDEPWPFDRFPVPMYRPRKRPGSAWSRGIPETLAAAQLKINQWNRRIDGILDLHAVPRLIASRDAKLNRSKFNNSLASVLECNGSPGNAVMRLDPNSVPRDLIERVNTLIAWAEKQVGLSELSIAAQKPAGINHEPGMQYLADTEAIRHTTSFRAWEDFHLDLAKVVVETIRLLAQRNEDFTVMFGDSKELRKIPWRSIDLKRSQYHLKTWPTNLLPQTPAAKLDRVLDMVERQIFTPEQALMALDFPDIEAILGDRVAERENISKYIERARKAGSGGLPENTVPNAYLNLQLAQQMAKDRINRGEADGENVDGVVEFFKLVAEELKKLAPPPEQPGGTGGPPAPDPTQPGPPGPAGAAQPIDPAAAGGMAA